MKVKEIKKYNDEQFLKDIKSVRDILVYMPGSHCFLRVLKKDVLKEAETGKIRYTLDDTIFKVKRFAMVIN